MTRSALFAHAERMEFFSRLEQLEQHRGRISPEFDAELDAQHEKLTPVEKAAMVLTSASQRNQKEATQ